MRNSDGRHDEQRKHLLYQAMFEQSREAQLLIDPESGRIVEANAAAEAFYGYGRERLESLSIRDLNVAPSEHLLEDMAACDLAQAHPSLFKHRLASGEALDVEIHCSSITVGDRRLLHAIIHDVTDRVRLLAELDDSRQCATLLNAQLEEHSRDLEKTVQARTRELLALYHVAAVASESLGLDVVMQRCLAKAVEVMGAELGTIHLLDEGQGALGLAAWFNVPAEMLLEIARLPVEARIAGYVVQRGAPVLIPAVGDDLRAVPSARDALKRNPYLGAPMHAKGRVVGVLAVVGLEGQSFGDEEMALLASIADQVGIAVDNAWLYREAEELAVLQERHRLARDLHDSVTQLLSSIQLLAESSRRAAESGDAKRSRDHLSRLNEVARQALREMRLFIYELRPRLLEHEDLVEVLQQRLDAVENRAGIQARLLVEGELTELDSGLKEGLYRIVQEALNNALKHANARSVTVRIRADSRTVDLEIDDDGQGFDMPEAEDAGGMGLANIRERAMELGGVVSIVSAPGRGTKVKVTVEGWSRKK